jgi:hypothetical protein
MRDFVQLIRQKLNHLFLCASVCFLLIPPAQLRQVGSAQPGDEAAETAIEPVPFAFSIEELSLSTRHGVIVQDSFNQDGKFQPPEISGRAAGTAGYFLSLGHINGANVKGGVLRIDQTNTINAYGTFVAKFVLPFDTRGGLSFSGGETFGDLVMSTKIRSPDLHGHERLKIGFGDIATMGAVASISLQRDSISLQRQGRAAWDEITLDRADISGLANVQEIELVLKVDAQGRFSGLARIRSDGKEREISLSHSDPVARINPDNANLTANLFIEDLPKPRVFSVYPESLPVAKLREMAGTIPLRVVGTGFAPDTVVEIVPSGEGKENPVAATDIRLLQSNSYLSARVRLPELGAKDYSLRITTGAQTTFRRNVIHVY